MSEPAKDFDKPETTRNVAEAALAAANAAAEKAKGPTFLAKLAIGTLTTVVIGTASFITYMGGFAKASTVEHNTTRLQAVEAEVRGLKQELSDFKDEAADERRFMHTQLMSIAWRTGAPIVEPPPAKKEHPDGGHRR